MKILKWDIELKKDNIALDFIKVSFTSIVIGTIYLIGLYGSRVLEIAVTGSGAIFLTFVYGVGIIASGVFIGALVYALFERYIHVW